jgi:hypothetical protein
VHRVRAWTDVTNVFVPASIRAQGVDATRRGRLAVATCLLGMGGGVLGSLSVLLNRGFLRPAALR